MAVPNFAKLAIFVDVKGGKEDKLFQTLKFAYESLYIKPLIIKIAAWFSVY